MFFKFPIKMLKYLLIFCTVDYYCLFVNANDWTLCNPPLTGSWLNDVEFISEQEGWAVGRNGVILHTVNSGDSWELQQTPVDYPPHIQSVKFIDNDTGFAIGGVFGRTFALKTTNGGKEWIDVSECFPDGGLRSIFITNSDIWVTHWRTPPHVSVSHNRTSSWNSDTLEGCSLIEKIMFMNDTIGFICGSPNYIGRTIDCGRTWRKVSDTLSGAFLNLCIVNNNIYVLGGEGSLVYSLDGGGRWQQVINNRGATISFFALYFRENKNAVIDDGMIIGRSPSMVIRFKDTDQSMQHEFDSLPIPPMVQEVALTSPNRLIGVCWNGAIYEITGLSDSCHEITENTGGHITTVDFHDSLRGCCATDNGELYITSDGGMTWEKSFLPGKYPIKSVTTFYNGRTMVVTAELTSKLFIGNDYNKTWTQLNDHNVPIFNAGLVQRRTVFKQRPFSNSAFSVIYDTLFFTNDAGKNWQYYGMCQFSRIDFVDERNLICGITFPTCSNGWAITVAGAVSHSSDSGRTWTPVANIPSITAATDIFFLDTTFGLVCGRRNNAGSTHQPVIFHTTDGGSSWKECENITFNPVLDLHIDLQFEANLIKIRGISCSELWVLSDQGLLYSSDTGKTWQQQILPQYGNLFTDFFINRNGKVIVVGDNSRIWMGSGYSDANIKNSSRHYFQCQDRVKAFYIYNLLGQKISKTAHSGLRKSASGVYILNNNVKLQNILKFN